MPITVTRPSLPAYEEYIEEIKSIFENCQLTNSGPLHQKLELALKNYLSVSQLALFVNGHYSLEAALQAMGIKKPNAEIITTPFTFVSTAHAITRCGFKPVFCDIRSDNYTIDPQKIESAITENTVAILPVHVYGNVCDVEAIEKIAYKHDLKVIYDGAHSFGVKYKGIGIGNFGDATAFSFHATKVFNTIEGGAVAFHDPKLVDVMCELRNFGLQNNEDVFYIGGNGKMDEFRAAMGLCNLRNIECSIKARQVIAECYYSHLEGVSGIRLCIPVACETPNYSFMPVYFDSERFGKSRDEVLEDLYKNHIHARKYFYPPLNELSCYKNDFSFYTPVSHDVSSHILALPIYDGITPDDVKLICEIILR